MLSHRKLLTVNIKVAVYIEESTRVSLVIISLKKFTFFESKTFRLLTRHFTDVRFVTATRSWEPLSVQRWSSIRTDHRRVIVLRLSWFPKLNRLIAVTQPGPLLICEGLIKLLVLIWYFVYFVMVMERILATLLRYQVLRCYAIAVSI